MTNATTILRPYRNLPFHELEKIRVAAWNACLSAARRGEEIGNEILERYEAAEMENRARVAHHYALRGNRPPRC